MARWSKPPIMKKLVVALCLVAGLASPALAAAPKLHPVKLPSPVWRDVDPENTVVIDTNQGRIIAVLVPEVAPQTVERFKQLVRTHFYDGLSFFRVVDDFMDQTGDPQNNGQGGSVLPNVPPEFHFKIGAKNDFAVVDHAPGEDAGYIGPLPVISQPAVMMELMADGQIDAHPTFCQGVLGLARAQDPGSGNSQFFLMRAPHTDLDENYAAFGRVIVGEDVVQKIKIGEPVPAPQDRMDRVQLLADMPEGVRPHVQMIDTSSQYFADLIHNDRAAVGDDFTLCDVDVAGQAR